MNGTGIKRLGAFKPVAVLAAIALAALLLGVVACGDDASPNAAPTGSPDGAGGSTSASAGVDASASPGATVDYPEECGENTDLGLIASLKLGESGGQFKQGEEVSMSLTLINCGDNVSRHFYPTSQRYEFIVVDENGVEVWRWSDANASEQVKGKEEIQPGEKVDYREVWDQKDSKGEQVPPGRYKVSGFSVGCSDESQADCLFGPVELLEITS